MERQRDVPLSPPFWCSPSISAKLSLSVLIFKSLQRLNLHTSTLNVWTKRFTSSQLIKRVLTQKHCFLPLPLQTKQGFNSLHITTPHVSAAMTARHQKVCLIRNIQPTRRLRFHVSGTSRRMSAQHTRSSCVDALRVVSPTREPSRGEPVQPNEAQREQRERAECFIQLMQRGGTEKLQSGAVMDV